MKKDETNNYRREIISMEEYLDKRQKLKEAQKKKNGGQQKNSAWAWAELYV